MERRQMDEIKQMDISYHREMKNNYLMITVDEAREQGFEARMLIGNIIEGLLKFRIRKSDNQCQFCYEITSRQPLGRLLETKYINAEQLRSLMLGIAQTLTRMEEYLLKEEQILLDPDFIYVDLDNFQPGLCLLPGKRGDFPQEFSELLRFLLGKVDHQDKEAVVLVYGLYRESLKDNYGLDNLLRWLIKEEPSNNACEHMKKEKMDSEKTSEISSPIQEMNTQREQLTAGVRRPNMEIMISSRFPKKRIIAWFCIIPLIFSVFWLQKGAEGVMYYITSGIWGGTVIVSAVGILVSVRRWKQSTDAHMLRDADGYNQLEVNRSSWDMIFDEEEPEYEEESSSEEDDVHTVLLWSRETQEDQRRLIPENPMAEQIVLAYYPFLIGKQERLVDQVIREETVSRLHVRIDRAEGKYTLTDLNSTNGTSINGRKLEANETVEIKIGDRVEIAHLAYCFQ